MTKTCFKAKVFSLLVLAVLVLAGEVSLFAGEAYEAPRPLKASEILPAGLLKGPFHKVDKSVQNDGYMNTYTVISEFGTFTAVSTASFRMRIEELKAVDAMRKMEQSDAFQSSLKDAGSKTVEGVKAVVSDPKKAFTGAVTGIGKMFQMAGESLRSSPGAGEDSKLAGITGYSSQKREYAYEFGVDAYSPNPVLQQELDKITEAGFAGGLSATVMKAMIPGGAGLLLSVTGSTQLLNDMIAKTPPTELRRLNREKLEKMGMDSSLIDLFIGKSIFTPRDQTLFIAALEDMKDTKNRSELLKFALSTDSEDLAAFRTRVAIMYAVYSRSVAPIKSFIPFGEFACGATEDTLVFIVPVDHLLWTEDAHTIAKAITVKAAELVDIKKKELWVAGTVTEKSRKGLSELGWTVKENADASLDWKEEAKKNAPKK
jgi:hypothetical protein